MVHHGKAKRVHSIRQLMEMRTKMHEQARGVTLREWWPLAKDCFAKVPPTALQMRYMPWRLSAQGGYLLWYIEELDC